MERSNKIVSAFKNRKIYIVIDEYADTSELKREDEVGVTVKIKKGEKDYGW